MRVAHVSDCYLPRLGGIETQVHGLARRQRDAGFDVEVITATPRARHDRTVREVVDGVPVNRATVNLPYELPVHPRPGREVLRIVEAAAIEVVHVHFGVVAPFAQGALPALVRAGVPVVVTVHSLWGRATGAFRVADAVTGWTRWPVALTAVSEAAADPLRAVLRGRAPVTVLPNGIDAAAWRLDDLPPAGDGQLLLVSAMRLAPRKRPLPLLEVLREVRRRVPAGIGVRAVVAGEGPQRAAMGRYLRRHGMDWVELPGRLGPGALRDLYRRAAVYVAPAVLEAFGIAALEARTAGVPIVARSETGVVEFVRDGVEGLLATSDEGLADAVTRLVTDSALRRRMATHNRTVPPAVTWDEVVARSVAAYERAAGLLRSGAR
ncbi:MAG: glycosyltransferase family 4 protein [Kineosporiaceae bacterium]